LRDAAAIDEVFKQYDADGGIWAVIHLAALKAVGESGEIPLAYYRVNVAGSISLMEVRDEPPTWSRAWPAQFAHPFDRLHVGLIGWTSADGRQ